MLRELLFVVVVALFVAFQGQWLAWGILFVCSCDVILDDVLSSRSEFLMLEELKSAPHLNDICTIIKNHRIISMLCALLFVVVVALFVAFRGHWSAWGIVFVCSCDVILDDVLSSSRRSSSCRVSSISWTVVDIHGLVANEISCSWLLFVWVVFYRYDGVRHCVVSL